MLEATITPAQLLSTSPEFLASLSPAELAFALHTPDLWLRDDQIVPSDEYWRSFMYLAGRGAGKTFGFACHLTSGIESGAIRQPALVGPNEDVVKDVQVKAIVAYSPPWFKAEPYRKGVRWPNGVVAPGRSAEVERPSSGENFDFVWMTEIVKWPESTRQKAFNDVTTACRVGRHPRYVIDTTSKGVNELILAQLDAHKMDPNTHRMRRGTMFDNPNLTALYLRTELAKYTLGTQTCDEEIFGKAFRQAAGSLWLASWIENNRRPCEPDTPLQRLFAWDPALSDADTADEQGLCFGSLGRDRDAYVTRDASRRAQPAEMATEIVDACVAGCTGGVVETNHAGMMPRNLLEAEASKRGMQVKLVPRDEPIPPRKPGTIYLKEYHTPDSKEHRASPAAVLAKQGRDHHVGELEDLEREQVSWVPGARRSPNRLDAAAYLVTELVGVMTPRQDNRNAVADATTMQQALTAELLKQGDRYRPRSRSRHPPTGGRFGL